MRKGMGLAVVLAFAAAAEAKAQRPSVFGGVDPSKIVYQPVDTSKVNVPIARPQNISFPSLNLFNYFPKLNLTPSKPTLGHSNFPTPAEMPGPDYLKAFGYQPLQLRRK